MKRFLIQLVRGYQRWISPMFPPHCRFYPTCSSYAEQAIVSHGSLRGSWLALKRLCRCHPLHPGGFDPVPPKTEPGSEHSLESRPETSHPQTTR